MSESPVAKQIDLVHTLIASHDHRIRFLSNPDGYLRSKEIVPSPELKDSLKDSLQALEGEFQKLGSANPFVTTQTASEDPTTMKAVAAAALVSAVAAVVSSAAAVTSATSAAKMAK